MADAVGEGLVYNKKIAGKVRAAYVVRKCKCRKERSKRSVIHIYTLYISERV